MARPLEDLKEKFWRRVEMNQSPEICWEWKGSKYKNTGYGQISHAHKNLKSHRLSYELHKDKIPEGMLVFHTCDNQSCVNPNHLFLGSWKDNVQDMIKKGRRRDSRGEKNGLTKLTDQQVREIREKYKLNKITGRYLRKEYSNFKLAKEYGITQSIISEIINYKRWKHVI